MKILEDKNELLAVRYTGLHRKQDYDDLYARLVKKSKTHEAVYLYEEAVDFGPAAFLSSGIGIWHDIKYGPSIRLEKNAIVSDSIWARLMTFLFKIIKPVWPFNPTEIQFFEIDDRQKALQWIQS